MDGGMKRCRREGVAEVPKLSPTVLSMAKRISLARH